MFQSLQATFVIITDLSQKSRFFLHFVHIFFKSFFFFDIQLAGFSSYVFPPRFVAWASQRISHLHRYSYYVASYALFPASPKQINCCLFLFFLGNTAQPCLAAKHHCRQLRHGICVKMLDNVGLRYPHRASGGKKPPRTLRPLPLLRFAVSPLAALTFAASIICAFVWHLPHLARRIGT